MRIRISPGRKSRLFRMKTLARLLWISLLSPSATLVVLMAQSTLDAVRSWGIWGALFYLAVLDIPLSLALIVFLFRAWNSINGKE